MALLYVEAIVTLISFLITDISVRRRRSANQFCRTGKTAERRMTRAASLSRHRLAAIQEESARVLSLWPMLALLLDRDLAPLLASNVPFVFHDGNQHDLSLVYTGSFTPEEPVDFFFTTWRLVGFFPWVTLALVTNFWTKARGVPGRRRVGFVAVGVRCDSGLCVAVFSIPGVGPGNSYAPARFPARKNSSPTAQSTVSIRSFPLGRRKMDVRRAFNRPGFRVARTNMTRNPTSTFRISWARSTTERMFWRG